MDTDGRLSGNAGEVNISMTRKKDVLFSRFSEVPIITLVVKDRAMCHNPVAPLVNRYWRDTFLSK